MMIIAAVSVLIVKDVGAASIEALIDSPSERAPLPGRDWQKEA